MGFRSRLAAAALALFPHAAAAPAAASPAIAARAQRMDRAFRDVSVTKLIRGAADGAWERYLIRGKGVRVDDLGTLFVTYDYCLSETIAGLRGEGGRPVVTGQPCEGSSWKPRENRFALVHIVPSSVKVAERSGPRQSGPFSTRWFEMGFSHNEIGRNGVAEMAYETIACPDRPTCEAMAEDLRALAQIVRAAQAAVERINQRTEGLVAERLLPRQRDTRFALVRQKRVTVNAARIFNRTQVCVRRPDQDCDRDGLWQDRLAVAELANLSLKAELEEAAPGSTDKAIAAVRLTCGAGECWTTGTGGMKVEPGTAAASTLILCKAGDDCRQTKEDVETIIALLTRGEVTPKTERPIIGDAVMMLDRSIVVTLRRTTDGHNLSGTVTYAPSDPNYAKVLHHLGPMVPGEKVLVPAWDD